MSIRKVTWLIRICQAGCVTNLLLAIFFPAEWMLHCLMTATFAVGLYTNSMRLELLQELERIDHAESLEP